MNMMGCAHSSSQPPSTVIPVCSGREGPDTPEGAVFKAGGNYNNAPPTPGVWESMEV
jgi:hypothetical protein